VNVLVAAAALVLAGARAAAGARPRREAKRLAAVCLLGVAAEAGALRAGLYGYAGGWSVWWLPPAWVAACWLLLAEALETGLKPLGRRPALAAAAGAAGGGAVFALELGLGAARTIIPAPAALVAVAALRAALLPLAFAVSRAAGRV
jgi:hypothetical protein